MVLLDGSSRSIRTSIVGLTCYESLGGGAARLLLAKPHHVFLEAGLAVWHIRRLLRLESVVVENQRSTRWHASNLVEVELLWFVDKLAGGRLEINQLSRCEVHVLHICARVLLLLALLRLLQLRGPVVELGASWHMEIRRPRHDLLVRDT